MSLTVGTGPLAERTAGEFNRPVPRGPGLIYLESTPRRYRGVFAGEAVVDSRDARLLHEYGHLPVLYFPERDVRADLLRRTSHSTRCPYKGEAAYWSVVAGGRTAENAVWAYPEPLAGMEALAGLVAFYWERLDEWWEEDERAVVHVRDPYHRIDVRDTSRRVRVLVGGEVVADSARTRVLFEAGLPPRWYFPPEDVRGDLLELSEKETGCAYKGFARYWSVRAGDAYAADVAWAYPDPLEDGARIRDRIAFFDERVDVEVDGERQERPVTQWS
jgi:uncharacterized protein (DUF427 family)